MRIAERLLEVCPVGLRVPLPGLLGAALACFVIASPGASHALCLSIVGYDCEPVSIPDVVIEAGSVPVTALRSVTITLSPDPAARIAAGRSVTRSINTTLAMRSDERIRGLTLAGRGGLGPNAGNSVAGRNHFVEGEKPVMASLDRSSGFSGFVTGTFDSGEIDAFDVSTGGLLAGVDYLRRDHWLFGAALGYSSGDVERKGFRDGVRSDTLTLATYASLRPMPSRLPGARLTANFSYGFIDLDERLWTSDGITPAREINRKINSQALSGRLLGSYEFGFSYFSLRPEAGLDYFRSHVGGVDLETLGSNAHNASAVYGSLGLVAEGSFQLAGFDLRPTARFRWMAAIDEDYDALVLTSSGHLIPLLADGDYFVVGGGLLVSSGRSFEANVSVNQIVGNDRLSATTLAAGLTYRF